MSEAEESAGFVRCRRCGARAAPGGGRCEFCGVAAPDGWRPELRGREIIGRHLGMAAGGTAGGVLAMVTAHVMALGAGPGSFAAVAWARVGGTPGVVAGLSWGALVGLANRGRSPLMDTAQAASGVHLAPAMQGGHG